MLRLLAIAGKSRRPLTGLLRLLVAVALTGHLGAAVHSSHTRHVVCPEHGEMVDVPAEQVGAALTLERGKDEWRAPQSAQVASGHEHCVLASFGRWPNLGHAAPLFAVSQAVVAAGQLAPNDVPRDTGIPIYRVAPKSSPPA